ncbi:MULTISPECIES: hypothetical protein [Clostridium]|uniref:Uncharacterized protein n=1 Tax=Clostridium frigoriphilum TaxID=443253 RepID=A0ABU7UUV7_9CLOT|nr:hypothetical protein [Clostridium sp. DSM 17811]MBU3102224.1 hypothetical protein [Clostridium sp. DSM 17811]
MLIKRLILNWIIICLVLIIALNLNLNRIAQFIVIFIGTAAGLLLVEYFLGKKS